MCPHGNKDDWKCRECHETLKKAIVTLGKDSQPVCKHPVVQFDRGGFHIVCEACKRVWVGQMMPLGMVPDYTMLGGPMSTLDVRKDPNYLPPGPVKQTPSQ